MKKTIFLVTIFAFVMSLNAYAKNIWEKAESDQYGEKAGGMVGRGLLNVVTSPIDIPAATVHGAQTRKPALGGGVSGFFMGAGCTILRAGSGILDVAFFWVPDFNGLPVSKKYSNCLDFSGATAYVAPAAPAPRAQYTPPPAPKVVQQAAPIKVMPSSTRQTEDRSKYIKK
jgi:putative exosortase-associated protein (TIGR04073 family)